MGRNRSLVFDETVSPSEYMKCFQMSIERSIHETVSKTLTDVLNKTFEDYNALKEKLSAPTDENSFTSYRGAEIMTKLSHSTLIRRVKDGVLIEHGSGKYRFKIADIKRYMLINHIEILNSYDIPLGVVQNATNR